MATNQNPYESPLAVEPSRRTVGPWGCLAGLLVFSMALVLGVFATRMYVDWVLPHVPAEEAYESLPRDWQAAETSTIGWLISFLVAVALSGLAAVGADHLVRARSGAGELPGE